MLRVSVVYENGVFRPLGPVELPEGAQLEVSVIGQKETRVSEATPTAETDGLLVGEELDVLLQRIDALPLESEADPAFSTTYRQILYPKQGEMP